MNDVTQTASTDIIFEQRARIGHVLLNRPKALNALTADMCEALLAQLRAWREDSDIHAVLIRGAGEKAFCSGGDVIRLYEDGRAKGPYPRRFYWSEYRCDTAIRLFPKPFVALVDGIVMGGGVGVSFNGSHRVVTERTTFAMPETGIGLFPDVGGTYFLPRLSGRTGIYLGLSGRRLKAADCATLGLAHAFVPQAQADALVAALAVEATADHAHVSEIIRRFAGIPEGGVIPAERADIDRHFGHDTIEAILMSLDGDGSDWAVKTAKDLRGKSPLSLKVTMRQLHEGATVSFLDAMRLEWRLASRFAADHDFYEGVRALLVDKDMTPHWRPATLAEVTPAMVDAYFAPLPGGELDLSDIMGG